MTDRDNTWDDAFIASAFIEGHTAPSLDGSYIPMSQDEASRTFWAWLAMTRAEAWGEGFDAGHYVNDAEDRDCGCRNNPYSQDAE